MVVMDGLLKTGGLSWRLSRTDPARQGANKSGVNRRILWLFSLSARIYFLFQL